MKTPQRELQGNMRKRIGLNLACSAFAIATTAMPAYAQQPQSSAVQAEEAAGPGDIVVTARKRAEDILETPIAVLALTAADLEMRGITSFNDIANNTPGLNISNVSSGRSDRSFQQISLRGFTPSTAQSTLTATFIDGVPVASPTALLSVTDPERIEILKGPQSAYFGRNTFAGAINVVNKLPGNDLGGSVSATVGTRNTFDVIGSIEGALVSDVLSFRVTGRSFSKSGSYVNAANTSQTLGDQKTATGTALIVLKPASDFTIKAFGLYSEDHDGPSAQGQLSAFELRSNAGAVNIPALSGTTAGSIIVPGLSNCNLTGFSAGIVSTEARVTRPFFCGAAPALPAGFSPAQNTQVNSLVTKFLADGTNRYVSPSDGVQGYGLKRKYVHLHLNMDYDISGTGVTLSSLTGYNNERFSELADLDNYDSSTIRNASYITGAFPNGNPAVLPYWDFPFLVERATRDFSQEFRASYDNQGRFRGTIGASYLWTRADGDLVSGNTEFVAGFPRPSTARSAPQQSKTLGAFFGLTYDLTDQFTVSAEGRYQQDEIFAFTGGNLAGLTINAGNTFGLAPGAYGPLTQFYSQKFKKFLPRVIAQYKFTPDLMGYASYSEGVNVSLASFNTAFLNGSQVIKDAAASIQLGVVVQPEKLRNYELGLKGKLLDGKLRFSLAAYFAEWRDQQNQRSVIVPLDAPAGYVAGTPCPVTYTCTVQIVSGIANSGRTIVKGLELDLTAVPTRGLEINLAASINDSNIRSFTDPSISKVSGLIGTDFVGKKLPASSKYSVVLGAQYGTPISGWEDGKWFVRGDMSYKSKQYTDPSNLAWIAARTLVNFRLGVSKGPASLEAYVTNAFNNRNYVAGTPNFVLSPPFFPLASTYSYLSVGLPDLRTFGLTGRFKF